MLSGKLPTGTVEAGEETGDGAPGRTTDARRSGAAARRDRPSGRTSDDRAAAASESGESAAGTAAGTAPDGRSAGTATDRPAASAPSRPGGPATDRRRDATTEGTEARRLKERLAAERAERQAVIDRYERLLDDRRATAADGEGSGADPRGGTARAWVRRALSRLRIGWVRRG